MFHRIDDSDSEFSINTNNFEVLMEYVSKHKSKYIITFDDAYRSVYDNAKPILDKYNINYYMFICNEYIDKDDYLTKDMIISLAEDDKCSIGSHLYKHVLARELSDKELEKYLYKSKKELEDIINKDIKDFAFPYGSFYAVSNKNINIAKKYFDNIYLTVPIDYKENTSFIPRYNMNDKSYKEIIK